MELTDDGMKEFPRVTRAAIYETAWRCYCVTQSEDYAKNRAYEKAYELGIDGYCAYDVARDAIEKIRRLMREYARTLLTSAPERVETYMTRFPTPTYYKPLTKD